ncbi:acyl-CoA dehydrogenase family protein [Streptomyces sp. B-S-A6]|uniref:Acyl-CoA dehydrogenase family protein n=2 Tax=Streptomyces cavernicola TaxID=3043613 RepID=A0ABT6SHP8_9ACTN|nr:acyl-CoA dehydrogenase family protein [Streptomyces sp. B-S-A6]MDI3406943.1 acyl-CoA dehydrogenase family protein [Streptomyces sp. B-S-A6]
MTEIPLTARLDDEERAVVEVVADFVDTEVLQVVRELEHANAYPGRLIEKMKKLGVYGLLAPAEYGGTDVSTACFALVAQELARGWMSLSGAMGGHSVVTYLIRTFGTPQQQAAYLPRMATGELRATMALTEPSGGSDLQNMRTKAVLADGTWTVNGSKTWITNSRRAGLIALLCRTEPKQGKGFSILLVEKSAGYQVSEDLPKLGYKGVESCEVTFDDVRVPESAVLGGTAGVGFAQMMRGLEIGRIQVASRALGVAQAALNDATRYAQERHSFGKPIWRHQTVGNYLAEGATKLRAARLLTLDAAARVDAGQRADMEAGMAKLFASEVCMEIALNAVRVHGGYGYSTEFDVERYFRDAPLMIVGEGTNEIQLGVIVKQHIARNPIDDGGRG